MTQAHKTLLANFHPRALAIFVSMTVVAFFAATFMATAADDVEEVVVTGSYIKGTPEDAALPVEVITGDDLLNQGAPSLLELIKTLGVSSGVDGESNGFQSNGHEGISNVNLRGLGVGRTLVLMNGRRLPRTPKQIQASFAADLNLIPAAAIARIEILKDGASATYGSDAVAGVVNLITRSDFEGLEFAGSFKNVDGSDGDADFGAIFGINNDQTSFIIAGGYNTRSRLPVKARSWAVTRQDFNARTLPNFSNWEAVADERAWSGTGNPGAFREPANRVAGGGIQQVPHPTNKNPDGSPVMVDASPLIDPQCNTLDGFNLAGQTCMFQYTPFWNLVEKQSRYQLFSELRHSFDDSMEAYVTALYGYTEIKSKDSSPSYPPQVSYDDGVRTATGHVLTDLGLRVESTHPALATIARSDDDDLKAAFKPITDAAVEEDGDGNAKGLLIRLRPYGASGPSAKMYRQHDMLRFVAGLEGTMADFDYNASLTWGQTKSDVRSWDALRERYQNTLKGLGGFDCDGTAYSGEGCLTYNPFSTAIAKTGGWGTVNPYYIEGQENDPALYDYIMAWNGNENTNTLLVADAVIATSALDLGYGEIMLPGGPLGMAFGAQWRKENFEVQPTKFTNLTNYPCSSLGEGDGATVDKSCALQTGPFLFLAGRTPRDVDQTILAVFTEFSLPLAEDLDAQLAVRYEDYGGKVGNSVDPKLALRWQAHDALTFRGSVGTTFRGPTLNQLVASYTELTYLQAASTYKAIDTKGRRDLKPESALTYNIGAILDMDELLMESDNFYFSVDYWAVDLEDPLLVESAPTIADNAFRNKGKGQVKDGMEKEDDKQNYKPFFVFQSTEAAEQTAANIQRVNVQIVNGPKIRTSGLDFAMRYQFDEERYNGLVGMDLSATNVLKYDVAEFKRNGVTTINAFDGVGSLNRGNFARPIPEWKGQFSTDYSLDKHYFRATLNYVDSYKNANNSSKVKSESTSIVTKEVDKFVTLDLNYGYTHSEDAYMFVSITNVADIDPPYASLDFRYDPYTHSPLGRVIKVGVRYTLY